MKKFESISVCTGLPFLIDPLANRALPFALAKAHDGKGAGNVLRDALVGPEFRRTLNASRDAYPTGLCGMDKQDHTVV